MVFLPRSLQIGWRGRAAPVLNATIPSVMFDDLRDDTVRAQNPGRATLSFLF